MTRRRSKKRPSVRDRKVAALVADLEWIFAGARGGAWGEDEFAGTEELERVIPAVCETLDIPLKTAAAWIIRSLDRWASPQNLAELLVDQDGHVQWLRRKASEEST